MILTFLYISFQILFLAEGRSPVYSLYEKNKYGESYLEVYSCSHPKNKHLHVFSRRMKDSHEINEMQNFKKLAHKFEESKIEKKERIKIKKDNLIEPVADLFGNETQEDIANRIIYIGGERAQLNRKFKATNLKYDLCGEKSSDLLKVKKMLLLSDPVFPGDFKVAFDVELKEDLPGAISMEVEAYKVVFGLDVLMPCFDGIGSCTYENACSLTHYENPCPEDFQRDGIPCSCPVKKGKYRSKSLKVYAGATDMVELPEWLTDGLYKIKITVKANGKRITCISGQGSMTQTIKKSK